MIILVPIMMKVFAFLVMAKSSNFLKFAAAHKMVLKLYAMNKSKSVANCKLNFKNTHFSKKLNNFKYIL